MRPSDFRIVIQTARLAVDPHGRQRMLKANSRAVVNRPSGRCDSLLIVVARPDGGRAQQNTQQTTEEGTILSHTCPMNVPAQAAAEVIAQKALIHIPVFIWTPSAFAS